MGRIKVTGYIDEGDVSVAAHDPGHSTGLTNDAYEELSEQFHYLDDATFEYVDD